MRVMRQIITRVPDDLAERLKERAAIENRSVNATVVDAVERVLAVPASRRQAWRARNGHTLVKRSPVAADARAQRPEYAAERGPALSAALDDDRSEP
ncbi:MAG: Arc family DNA-binding protein [Candidatus Dormibacteria bacterium]